MFQQKVLQQELLQQEVLLLLLQEELQELYPGILCVAGSLKLVVNTVQIVVEMQMVAVVVMHRVVVLALTC